MSLDQQTSSQERLQIAVAIAKLGTYEWDIPSGAVQLDARGRQIFGFGAQEPVFAGDIFGRIHPDDVGWVKSHTTESVRLGRPVDVQYRVVLPDGQLRHVSSAGQMLRGADGATAQVFGVFADQTERVRAAEALRDSEARFRTIANAMPQMLWSTRPDGYHDYYNDRWYEYTGAAPGTTDGESWNGMFHPEDQPRAWDRWCRSLASGEPYEIEYRLRHRSGHYRWVLGRAMPIRDEAGAIVRWMGTCTDIHDQKTLRDELASLNRRKDEFLAMLAHELRNPLAPISTAAHLLKSAADDPGCVERSADIIARQVRHMTGLVNELLDVSRVTRGLVELRKAPVDLKSVLVSAIEQSRPLIASRGHELVVRRPAGHAVVLGDEQRLVQIVTNVLTNAAKYTPSGGHLSMVLEAEGQHATLKVSDNGIGVEPDLLPHIFDLFVQGRRTPDRSQGGLGLGLALAKSLVGLHGGQITAASEGPGRGSTFEIRLPLHAGGLEAGDVQAGSHATAASSVKVLLVDDNADAVEMLGELIGHLGHQVQAVTDVDAALELTSREQFDVLILDIGLPKMDGYELARRIRSQGGAEGSTFIALSGYGQDADKEAARAAGFDHHYVKPVDIGELTVLLAEASGKAKAPQ